MTACACDPRRLVCLEGGLVLPQEPVRLYLSLQARGCTIRVEDDDLVISPARLVRADEVPGLRRWKLHLLTLAAYDGETVQ